MRNNPAGTRTKSKAVRYITALLYPFIMSGLVSLFVLPGFLHCIDPGKKEMTVDELAAAKDFPTKNITITGYPLLHEYVSLEETNFRSRVTSYTYFVPVISANAKRGDALKCVMQITGKELDELIAREKQEELPMKITTVIRNTLWEGLDDDIKEEFQKSFKIDNNEVLLVEYGLQSSFPLWLCGIVFFFAVMGSYMIIKGRV